MMDYYSGSPSRHSNRRSSIRKSNYSFRRRRRQHNRIPILLLILLLVAVVGCGIFICIRQFQKMKPEKTPGNQSSVTVSGSMVPLAVQLILPFLIRWIRGRKPLPAPLSAAHLC